MPLSNTKGCNPYYLYLHYDNTCLSHFLESPADFLRICRCLGYDAAMKRRSENTDIPPILWILLAAVILISAALFLPSIIRNIRSYESLLHESSRDAESAGVQPVLRALAVYRDNGLHAEVTGIPVYGSSAAATRYDRLMTALLRNPRLEELEQGYLTMIPAGTSYIGSRLIRNTLYIEFSSQFFEPHPLGDQGRAAAVAQIAETLREAEGVHQFLLIHRYEIKEGPVPVR